MSMGRRRRNRVGKGWHVVKPMEDAGKTFLGATFATLFLASRSSCFFSPFSFVLLTYTFGIGDNSMRLWQLEEFR